MSTLNPNRHYLLWFPSPLSSVDLAVTSAVDVTVGRGASVVLSTVIVMTDCDGDAVDNTVIVGMGAVTVCIVGVVFVRAPMIAEIPALTDAVGSAVLIEVDGVAVTVMVTSRFIVCVIVAGFAIAEGACEVSVLCRYNVVDGLT